MKTSKEFIENYDKMQNEIVETIIQYFKDNNITSLDLTTDLNGKSLLDEDFDDIWVEDNRVWVECYGKYGNETGYLSSIEYDGKYLSFTAEGECYSYEEDNVEHTLGVYIDILLHLETRFKNN